MKKLLFKLLIYLSLFFSIAVYSKEIVISPLGNYQEDLQEALILAKPGDTIILKEGFYSFSDGLSLDVDDVRLIGEGMDKSILSFSNQKSGAQGLLVTSNRVVSVSYTHLTLPTKA